MVQNVVLVFLRRRLSQRPNVEELESRNILKREFRKLLVKKKCVLMLQIFFFCASKSTEQ